MRSPAAPLPARKTRLCVVMGGHWDASRGGAEFQAMCLMELIRMRSDFEAYYLAHKVAEARPQAGYPVIRIGSPKPGMLHRLADLPSIYRRLGRLRPSVVYQRSLMPYTAVCALYCRRHRIPFVFHVAQDVGTMYRRPRGWGAHALLRRVAGRIAEYGLRHADLIVAQTHAQARQLYENYGLRAAAVVPNFHPSPPPQEVGRRDPARMRVIWVGNFKPIKRPALFVDLAAAFAARRNVRFVMIGRPGEERTYRALHARMAAMDNLDYLGELPVERVNAEIASSDILVNTSAAEGFPNTFIQAWLRGVPVVSCGVDPDGCLSRDGAGIVADGPQRLARVLGALLEDRSRVRELGESARAHACAHHLPERAQPLIDLLAGAGVGAAAGSRPETALPG